MLRSGSGAVSCRYALSPIALTFFLAHMTTRPNQEKERGYGTPPRNQEHLHGSPKPRRCPRVNPQRQEALAVTRRRAYHIAPTYTVTGKLVPPQGEVMRLTLDDDLLDELGWDASFARSLDVLERMADDALAEYEAGQTKLLDIDDL